MTKLISEIQLFHGLSDDILFQLKEIARIHYYKKGAIIFNSQQADIIFGYIIKGWIKLSRSIADGSEVIIDILNDKYFIGENFILENDSESFDAEAISDLELLVFPIKFLRELTNSNHQFSLNLLKWTMQKQHKLTFEMEHLSIKNAAQRIGCFLLRLCTLKKSENITLRLPYDKALLACRLGMRPETFSRALAKICSECEIKSEEEMLHIKSVKNIVQFVCQHCSQTYPCKDIMR